MYHSCLSIQTLLKKVYISLPVSYKNPAQNDDVPISKVKIQNKCQVTIGNKQKYPSDRVLRYKLCSQPHAFPKAFAKGWGKQNAFIRAF